MLVGLDYFLSHRIYVSRLQGKVYATWNGGPVFALGTAKPGQYDTRYAALPGEIAPDNADALARRGSAALASGDLDRALADLDRACAAAPAVAEYRFLRARVRLSLRQPQPAMADLDEALRLDPSHAEARFHRASVRFGSGDRPGMEADLAQLDEALPRSAQLRGDMAELYATADQVPQALRQFELWMATHAKDARLASMLNNRCWMRARLNLELPLALEDCLAAVKQDRADPASRDSLGWTYLRLGDAAQAKNAFDVALELKTQAISLYGRALARAQLKDAAGAAADLAQARRIQPSVDDDVRLQKLPTAEAASATPAT
jgi:tetratricopeptide (TPR) repeat protein